MTRALRLAACLAMAVTSTAAIAQSEKAEPRRSKPVVVVTQDLVRGHVAMNTCMDASLSFHTERRPLSFKWDFGDGRGTATRASACHKYRDPGLYAASITVTDDRGVTESRTVIVSVTPMTSPGM
jgi:PKD domain-containing protein